MSALIRKCAVAVCAAALAVPALAGGDDYDAMNDTEGKGPAYFGFVRDTRGSPVSDAQVILRPKKGEPVMLKSNVLGLYRSHLDKDDPAGRGRSLLRQDRLQAGRCAAPPGPGQGHAHRDQLHAAAVVAWGLSCPGRPRP